MNYSRFCDIIIASKSNLTSYILLIFSDLYIPRWWGFSQIPSKNVGFFAKKRGGSENRPIFQLREDADYESFDFDRKPKKKERRSAVDAHLLCYVYLLADGIYLLFP